MNKEELVSAFSRKTGMTKVNAEYALNKLSEVITDALVAGDKVQLVGFGTFEVKNRAPRTGRNVKANVPVHIPARKAPVFTPGAVLKSAVENSAAKVK